MAGTELDIQIDIKRTAVDRLFRFILINLYLMSYSNSFSKQDLYIEKKTGRILQHPGGPYPQGRFVGATRGLGLLFSC